MTWNVFSLVLGIIAWCFAFVAIKGKKKHAAYGCSVVSFSLCVISLFFQFLEIGCRANNGDYAGIEDTIGAVIVAAGVLAGATIILNVVAIIRNQTLSFKV